MYLGQQRADRHVEPGTDHLVRLPRAIVQGKNFGIGLVDDLVVCAGAAVYNSSDAPLSYGFSDFKLMTPSGDIRPALLPAGDVSLRTGQLAPEGQTTGVVCFPYSGTAGRYVLSYEADPRARAVWVFDCPVVSFDTHDLGELLTAPVPCDEA